MYNWLKNIEDIEVWDVVLSYNTLTQRNEYNKVIKKFVHENMADELYQLTIGENVLQVTSLHKFYVIKEERNFNQCWLSYEWIVAKKLKVWDILLMSDGSYVTVKEISHHHYYWTVYNLWIENVNNYYVDKWYLVHNSNNNGDHKIDFDGNTSDCESRGFRWNGNKQCMCQNCNCCVQWGSAWW